MVFKPKKGSTQKPAHSDIQPFLSSFDKIQNPRPICKKQDGFAINMHHRAFLIEFSRIDSRLNGALRTARRTVTTGQRVRRILSCFLRTVLHSSSGTDISNLSSEMTLTCLTQGLGYRVYKAAENRRDH
jgi:hypothetical protein